jgi:hypothetical protein
VSRIATDNNLGGQKAAEALDELLPGAKGKVLVISTDPGVSSVDARVVGFGEAVKSKFSNFTLASDTQYSHNSPQPRGQRRPGRAAAHPGPGRRVRHQPVHRAGRRDRRAIGGQDQPGEGGLACSGERLDALTGIVRE